MTTRLARTALISIAICTALIPLPAFSQQTTPAEAERALRNALGYMESLQTNGGWAMAWTDDLKYTYGEYRIKTRDLITVQPPATPGMGELFLRAGRVLKDDHFIVIAMKAGDALIAGQLENGGWPHEFTPGEEKQTTATFDDDASQSATRFLVHLWQETGEERFAEAAKRAAQFIIDAQYENGGWPQRVPGGSGYGKNITLNDQAMMDIMRTLFLCSEAFDDPRYREAAIRGGECLLALRGAPPQAGWAQQFTPDGEPAPARRFEPTALSSYESMDAVRILRDVYLETGDKRFIEACPPVFDWMKRSRLPNGKWARFYEYGSNQPLYCTESGEIIFDVNNARPGYGWQGSYYDEDLEREIMRLLETPAGNRLSGAERPSAPSMKRLQDRAAQVIDSLDEKGRWITPLRGSMLRHYREREGVNASGQCIHTGVYAENGGMLLELLESMSN